MGATHPPIAATLAAFAVDPQATIPNEVRARAKLHLLDALGCGLAAVGLDAGAHASAVAVEQGGAPQAALLGDRALVPAPLAALANGTRCHALDFDDTHERGICHSSVVVGPAALAVGQAEGRTGGAVLDAYVLGGEVALRIAVAAADALYERGFHPTPIGGAFGAAAAASRLLDLDAERTTNALGIVGSFASGLFEYLSDGSATKPIHAGWAAQAGAQAARMARAGATGPASVIEGRFGLLSSHTGSTDGAAEITAELGSRWEVAESSIKPYPACHFAHSSAWAAGLVADEQGLEPDDIAEVIVRIPAEGEPLVLEPSEAKATPQTAYDAKFSLPYITAHRLVHGQVDLASFTEERIRDRKVLALAERVRGEPLPEGESTSRFAGGARLTTTGGEVFDRFLEHAPGSPGNPLSDEWIEGKFRANAALGLRANEVDELLAELRGLEGAAAVDRIGELLGTARPSA